MKDNYTISEVAKMFNVTANKIRFYEKKELLNPKRQVENEYRRFNNEDLLRLQSILLYRSMGIPLKDIKNILDNSERQNYLTHFNDQWELVNNELHRLNNIRKSLENVIDKLYEETSEFKVDEDVLNIINKSNELYHIKNNWKDKWDFNHWAKTYDKDVIEDRGALKIYENYELILKTVYEMVINEGMNNPNILEIGVGTGNLAGRFLKTGFNIIGIDQSREMLAVAKEKYPKLKVRLGEFLKIPYGDKCFDVIISTYAFHHLNNVEKTLAIEEMLRVLKETGTIIIGDLMFENNRAKEEITAQLSQQQIEEIEDEFYSDIDFLEGVFEKYNKKLEYIRIDKFNYIINV